MIEKKIICWRNKFSGEEGFVKKVSHKLGYFEATKNENEAKTYSKDGYISRDLDFFDKINETENNEFFVRAI